MKKIIAFIVAIFAILPCSLALVGCFGNDDGGKDEFKNATPISVTELHQIRLDEAYKFKFGNFQYEEKNEVEGVVEHLTMKLLVSGQTIKAEGFYSYPETETDDRQTAYFYIFNGKMYVNRAELYPVKTTGDANSYGKFSFDFDLANGVSLNSLSGFAKKLATIINRAYTVRIDSRIIMGDYAVDGNTHARYRVVEGSTLKLRLTSNQEFSSTSQTTTTETKLYYSAKNVYRIYSSKTDVFAEVNMPVITNRYQYLVQSFSGSVNTEIPVEEYVAI